MNRVVFDSINESKIQNNEESKASTPAANITATPV